MLYYLHISLFIFLHSLCHSLFLFLCLSVSYKFFLSNTPLSFLSLSFLSHSLSLANTHSIKRPSLFHTFSPLLLIFFLSGLLSKFPSLSFSHKFSITFPPSSLTQILSLHFSLYFSSATPSSLSFFLLPPLFL